MHNDDEDLYEPVLKKYCDYIDVQIFGKNTALHSSLILIAIGGYIGILFLKYKIQKYYPKNNSIFYKWNQGNKCNTLKIIIFSFLLPIILVALVYLLVPYKYFILKMVLFSLVFLLFGFLSNGLCLYYSCVFFKKNEMCLEEYPLDIV